MFRVTLFIDDKKLSQLLHSLTGVALGSPEIHPVANAHAKKGKVVAKTGGSGVERFLEHLQKHKMTQFTVAEAKEAAKAVGLQPSSVNYLCSQLRKAGLLRHNGKTGPTSAYMMITKKPKPKSKAKPKKKSNNRKPAQAATTEAN